MKLLDLDLTDDQIHSLLDLLDQETARRHAREAAAERDAAEAELADRRYEKVCELARETARLNGPIEGLGAGYAAAATWEAFTACKGWFSPYDVDDWFPNDVDEYREAWELSYVEQIEAMVRERKAA